MILTSNLYNPNSNGRIVADGPKSVVLSGEASADLEIPLLPDEQVPVEAVEGSERLSVVKSGVPETKIVQETILIAP